MTAHPFPNEEPQVVVTPRTDADLKEVLRVDLGGGFVPLEVGAEVKWSFYDWPERILTNVSHTRVVGTVKYRGEECLDIVDRLIWPEGEYWWNRSLYRVRDETLAAVLQEIRESERSGTIRDADQTPMLLRLRLGQRWQGHEVYRCGSEVRGAGEVYHGLVDGPFSVSVPAGSMLCLRDTWWVFNAEGVGETLAESYVAEDGRTIYFRRFNGPGWRNYEQLAANPERKHDGVAWRLWYECLPEISLVAAPQ